MKKITQYQLNSLKISPRLLAKEIHKLCPNTKSGRHYPRIIRSMGYKFNQCRFCGRKMKY